MTHSSTETGANIYPMLSYRDAAPAIEWLARAFGFRKRLVVPGPEGTVRHAEMSFGPGVIMLSTSRDDEKRTSPRELGGSSQSLSVFVEDVDAHHRAASEAGAEIVMEPHDMNFGARGYMVLDPEGHFWCFSNYRPGAHWG